MTTPADFEAKYQWALRQSRRKALSILDFAKISTWAAMGALVGDMWGNSSPLFAAACVGVMVVAIGVHLVVLARWARVDAEIFVAWKTEIDERAGRSR